MFLDGEIFRKTEKFPRARGRAHGEGRTPFGSRRPDPHEGDKGMGGRLRCPRGPWYTGAWQQSRTKERQEGRHEIRCGFLGF